MREQLQARCGNFIANRDLLRKQLKMESSYLYPICANIFCVRGVMASPEALAACKEILKSREGLFSNFRGNLSLPVISMLAVSPSPEARMDQAIENYAALKSRFFGSQYLALAAFVLADMDVGSRVEAYVDRGHEIYKRMKKEHPFLTSAEDSVFAVLLSFTEKTDDQLIDEMEQIYHSIKKQFSGGNAVQTVSHVLSLVSGDPELKTQRFLDLYNGILQAGGKYGRSYQLSTLAAASLSDREISELVQDMMDVDQFLAEQNGYSVLSVDRRTRMMHAAMIASDRDPYQSDILINSAGTSDAAQSAAQTAAIASTLALLAAQQAAMCAALSASSASYVASK